MLANAFSKEVEHCVCAYLVSNDLALHGTTSASIIPPSTAAAVAPASETTTTPAITMRWDAPPADWRPIGHAYRTVFGDPTLQVRTAIPTSMSVTAGTLNPCDDETYGVQVSGVEGALCALYADSTFFGSAYTSASGNATITIDGTMPTDEGIILTVTAFNKLPYIDTLWQDTDGDGKWDKSKWDSDPPQPIIIRCPP